MEFLDLNGSNVVLMFLSFDILTLRLAPSMLDSMSIKRPGTDVLKSYTDSPYVLYVPPGIWQCSAATCATLPPRPVSAVSG